jgi:hypothetical protein
MAALRAEFPPLETVHVRKRAARGAPDNEVHDKEVMRVIVIKIYRRSGWQSSDWNVYVYAVFLVNGPALCRCKTKSLY